MASLPPFQVTSSGFTGNLGPNSTPGATLQNGWQDNSGGVWSVSSGLLYSNLGPPSSSTPANYYAATYGALLRPISEQQQDGRVRLTFNLFSLNCQPYVYIRHNRSTTGATCYAANVTGNSVTFYTFVNGVPNVLFANSLGSTNIPTGATYVLDFAAVGVNPTVLIAGLYAADGITPVGNGGGIPQFQDSTSALQSGVGSIGIGVYNASGASTPFISAIATYSDTAGPTTTYSLSGPSAGQIGIAAGPFQVAPSGGTLTTASVITLSDNGALGTFSVGGTIASAATIAAGTTNGFSFLYTPEYSGTKSLSTTNSTSLINPPALPFNVQSPTYWYGELSTAQQTFSNTGTVSAGGTLQNGWVDIYGGAWEVNSSGGLQSLLVGSPAVSTALLQAATSSITDYNVRITGTGIYNNCQLWFVARHNGSKTSPTCYSVNFNGNALVFYVWTNGGHSSAQSQTTGASAGSLPSPTAQFWYDFQVVQTNSTTTTLTLLVYSTNPAVSGNLWLYGTWTDTTAAMQNINGLAGVAAYWASSNTVSSLFSAQVYTDVQPLATGFMFTVAPATGQTGVASSFTITTATSGITGGGLSGAVTLTLSDGGAGGTFSPATLSFGTSTTTASFTYTASTAAHITISAAITSGGSGLTAPTSQTFSASAGPATYLANSSYVYYSPGNWTSYPTRNSGNWRQSWNNGAWFQFSWTASVTPTLILNISSPSASTYPPSTSTAMTPTTGQYAPNKFSYFLNNQFYDNGGAGFSVPATGAYQITSGINAGGSNTLRVYLRNSNQACRWGACSTVSGYTPLSFLKLSSIQIDGSSTPIAPSSTARPWGMIVGDSITEGIQVDNGADNHLHCYSYFVAQCMDDAGFDTCISACGYSGWLNVGDYTYDVPGYNSRWNLIDYGVSLLDGNGQISSYGATGTTPSFILINYGTNEVTYQTSTTNTYSQMQAQIITQLGQLRAAAPTAVIAVLLPFPFYTSSLFTGSVALSYYVTALKTAVQNYQAQNPGDGKTILIDLGATACQTVYATPSFNNANVHPLYAAHAFLAPRVARALCQALKIAPPIFRGGTFGRL